jgi:hypothetical protein
MSLYLLKSHAMRAGQAPARDPRLVKADGEYREWLKGQSTSEPELDGRIDFNGLPCCIETGRSRCREWHNPQDGTQGMSRMLLPYGYIEDTLGADGDELDVFVGIDRQAPEVYVVHTTKAPGFTEYDEDKCFAGLASAEEALRCFHASYSEPRFFGSMSVWPFEDFKEAVFKRKGERLDNVKYIPPIEPDLEQAVAEPLQKSGEAICKQIGDSMGIDWDKYSLDEFCDGMFDEQEHADVVDGDQQKIARIVLKHLDEDPEFYSHMKTAKDAGIMKSVLSRLGR